MPRTLALPAVALVLLLAGVAAGCGGDDENAAQEWADSVCSELDTWADSMTTAITGVMSQGLSISATDLRAAANQASAASSRLVEDLREIGPPETESGEQAQDELQQLTDDLEEHANNARDLVQDAPSSAAGLVEVTRSLLVEVGSAADQVEASLDSMGQLGDDLRTGFDESDTCTDLRDRDFAVG